jgi:DNA/RNA endonuclease G (NUC1)
MLKPCPATLAKPRLILPAIVALFIFVFLGLQIFFARHVQAMSTTVVISEFRTRGLGGANDEFVELYNVTGSPINIGNWKINRSNGTGTVNTQITISAGTMIPAFGHFLATNSSGYSGSVPGNQTYGTGITDDGGIAILNDSNVVIDQVGMSAGSAYKEGNLLSQLTTNVNRSHERKAGGANGSTQDTDDNGNDFQLITPSDPQNLSSPPTPSGPPTPTNPTGVGAADPSILPAGSQTLLTVTVTLGSNPASTGINVSGNLSSIGGSETQQFFDDGTNGDVVAANNVFSYAATVSVATTTGAKTIPFSIIDAQARSGSGNISLTVTLPGRNPAEHLAMGNPSGAVSDIGVPLNYLMMKPQYALSYNNDKGIPNWTSWHLDSTWIGAAPRQGDFRVDSTLPPSFKHVSNGYQFGIYGFQRGHVCPSADRTSSDEDNSATFLMTNMIPQAPGNNEGPWVDMEGYIRAQLSGTTNELYIISGGAGIGGNSPTGHWDSIIDTAGNTVAVPRWTWKVVMVLPDQTGDDVARVSTSTRTFAVIMPNDESIRDDPWQKYLATVDQVEALSTYDFYSNVPATVQAAIEAELDIENDTAPVTTGQTKTTVKDQPVAVALSATDFNVNNTFTYIVDKPEHGSVSCAGPDCIYTPNLHYVGPDRFTFKVNDGALDSNVSTITITVNDTTACSAFNNGGVFNNGEWIIEALDSSIPEAPFEVRINGSAVCTTKLLAFANRVSGTSQFPQVFDLYSSGYIRMKAGADPSPPLPFGQSLVLGPAIFGTSASFPAPTLFFRPQLQRVDVDTSRLNPDGAGTLLINVTANDSGLAPAATNTNQIMNQTWGIDLHEPTNDQTRIDVAGKFTFTETTVPDPTRTSEFQSFRLLQISSMFIDSARHDVDAFRVRSANGPVTFFYNSDCFNQLCPPTPSALDGILESLHTDDAGQPNGNTPSYRILMGTTTGPVSGSITPRAFLTPSQDFNDDNLGLWLHQQPLNVIPQGTSGTISYTVLATTDPLQGNADLQFGAPNYEISEDRTLNVTVNRSGDTSAAATVNYATNDTYAECNLVNGKASAKCDYATAGGTLRFAAGESTRTIVLSIINDGYMEGNETFTLTLTNPTGASLGSPATTTITVADNDQTLSNPFPNNDFFVRQQYLDFLLREPDPGGFNDWMNVLTNCQPNSGGLGSDPTCDRVIVSSGFFRSTEFGERGYWIYRYYHAALGRRPQFAEFVPDMRRLSGFLSPAEQEAARAAFVTDFMQRPEFVANYGGLTNAANAAQFIAKLEEKAQVTLPGTVPPTQPGQPPQFGRDELIQKMQTGQFTAAQTLQAFIEQKVVFDAFFFRAFVTMQYFGYLQRDPEQAGFDDWVDVLTNGRGTIRPGDFYHLIFGFVYSIEYRARFGPP